MGPDFCVPVWCSLMILQMCVWTENTLSHFIPFLPAYQGGFRFYLSNRYQPSIRVFNASMLTEMFLFRLLKKLLIRRVF
jgi:hypothetical protein